MGLAANLDRLEAVPKSILLGAYLLALSSLLYYLAQPYMSYVTVERVRFFAALAYSYFAVLFICIAVVAYGVLKLLEREKARVRTLKAVPITWRSLIAYALTKKRYSRLLFAASLTYGLFYSFITSTIIYQPTLKFSEAHLVTIPSASVIPCCGSPAQIPILVVYLTEHLGVLLVPLSLILLIVVSILVGLNLSLATFSHLNRPNRHRGQLFGGLGALVGLFTGCPTCAGLFLASSLGGPGAVATATLLSSLQPLFIGVSIPVLLITPILISRNLSKGCEGGCLVNRDVGPRLGRVI
jgi:hypothetical protein